MASDTAVKSAERAIDLIELVARHGSARGFTLTELAQQLDLPKSSVHGLVHTLQRRGYLSQDDTTRTFHLGLRLWELGRAFDLHDELVRLVLPIMRGIAADLNEIVQLAVRDGIHNVYLAKVDCDQPIQLISRVGARLHCHATGLGKALLSGLGDEEIDRLYDGMPLPQLTANTILDLEALKQEVRRVRAAGYAEDREEYVPGLRCVAVPLRSRQGQVLAAMSVSLPTPRATADRLARSLSLLHEGAQAFQQRLAGATGDAPGDEAVMRAVSEKDGSKATRAGVPTSRLSAPATEREQLS
jgi:DNA-binding IclR family transcriptional regulator